MPSPDPRKAKDFAVIAHGNQVYNEEMPYIRHLEMVVEVLRRFGVDDSEMECAAWLHDVIEDTTRSYKDIQTRFGVTVAELVFSVTSELGRNRKERNGKTYPKIRSMPLARLLKLADRIANVEYGLANGGKTDMYRDEFEGFREGLNGGPLQATADDDTAERRMWAHLACILGKSLEPPRAQA